MYWLGISATILTLIGLEALSYLFKSIMKRDVKTVRLPDTYFEMQYLDMKEGLDDNNEYFTKVYDDSDRYFSGKRQNISLLCSTVFQKSGWKI